MGLCCEDRGEANVVSRWKTDCSVLNAMEHVPVECLLRSMLNGHDEELHEDVIFSQLMYRFRTFKMSTRGCCCGTVS